MNEQEKAKESSFFSLILFPFPLLPTTSRDDLCKAPPLRLLAIYLKFQFNTCCAFFFAESTQITALTDNLSMQRALRKQEKKKARFPVSLLISHILRRPISSGFVSTTRIMGTILCLGLNPGRYTC